MNTDAQINISIPKPCHEDWNKFTPDQKGAFCKVCSKSVHDFTQKTPEQIKTILVEEMGAGKKVCGRFNQDQLSSVPELPPLDPVSLNFRKLRKFALAAFLVFGGLLFSTNTASAQIKGKIRIQEVQTMKGEVAVCKQPVINDSTANDKIKNTSANDTIINGPLRVSTGTNKNPEIEKVNLSDLPEENVMMGDIQVAPEPSVKTDTIPADTIPVIDYPLMGMVSIKIPDTVLTDKLQPPSKTTHDSINSITDNIIHSDSLNNGIIENKDSLLIITSSENKISGNEPALLCYPDPSDGIINLKYTVKEKTQTGISLYNLNGTLVKVLLKPQELYAAEYNTQFDLSELPNGIYFCELLSGDKKITKRIILNK